MKRFPRIPSSSGQTRRRKALLPALLAALSPASQFEAHPAAALLWLLAALATAAAPILWLEHRPESAAVAAVAGGLWLNVIAGGCCRILLSDWESQVQEPSDPTESPRQPGRLSSLGQPVDKTRRVMGRSLTVVRALPGSALGFHHGSRRWLRRRSSRKET